MFRLLGGTIAYLLQIELPPWSAAVVASLVNPEQDPWKTESQQLHTRVILEIATVRMHLAQVRTFARHCGAHKQSTHILTKLCRPLKQPTDFILHPIFTQENILSDAKNFFFPVVLCFMETVTLNVHILPQISG